MVNLITSSRYKLNKKFISQHAQAVLVSYDSLPKSTINIVFVGKRKMKKIAMKYKHENVALPVLSFRYADKPTDGEFLVGEIFICYPQAILLAAEREKKVDEMMVWLIKHGVNNLYK